MSTPRKPLVVAPLLAAAAPLHFRPTVRDRSGSTLGVLGNATGAEQYLLTPGEADGTWTLSSALPVGIKPVLLYESAANVLRGGSLDANGSISYQGGAYRIESVFDGKSWTAKVAST